MSKMNTDKRRGPLVSSRSFGLSADDRFNAFTDRRRDDECWPWLGALDRYGYGRFSLDGKRVNASRFALSRKIGRTLEPTEHCLHSPTCTITDCVNPRHLRPGTPRENTEDKYEKTPTAVFHGKPCGRCGGTERLVSTKRCRACNTRWVAQSVAHRKERDKLRGHPCQICERPMDQPCYDELDDVFFGWLCHGCNIALGQFRHDPAILTRAFEYLTTDRGQS